VHLHRDAPVQVGDHLGRELESALGRVVTTARQIFALTTAEPALAQRPQCLAAQRDADLEGLADARVAFHGQPKPVSVVA
jgi:hypothetical protein